MKIPKIVRIAGHNYKVMWDDKRLSKEELLGDISNDFKVIALCKYYKGSKRARAKSDIALALIHEIMHGINRHFNNDSLSEKMIDRLTNGLFQVLSDNFKITTLSKNVLKETE